MGCSTSTPKLSKVSATSSKATASKPAFNPLQAASAVAKGVKDLKEAFGPDMSTCRTCGKENKLPNEIEVSCPVCVCGAPLSRTGPSDEEELMALTLTPAMLFQFKPRSSSAGSKLYFRDLYGRSCKLILASDGLVAGTTFEIAVETRAHFAQKLQRAQKAQRAEEKLHRAFFVIDMLSLEPLDAGLTYALRETTPLPDTVEARIVNWSRPGKAGASPQQIPVQVPEGATPGTMITFSTPDGGRVQVQVPDGAKPGTTFAVQV